MGVREYQKSGRTLFKLDAWLKSPNGTLHRVREANLPTLQHAEMRLAKLKLDAFEGRFFQQRLENEIRIVDCWAAWEPITRRDNASYRSDVCRAKHLKRLLGPRVAIKLTREDVEWYRQRRLSEPTRSGRPPSPATLDREVALLKRIVSYQVECGKLSRNPIAKVPLLNVPNTRDMVLRGSMLERIKKAAPPAAAQMIEFDVEAGLRKSELRILRWDQIDFAAGCIRLNGKDTKTDRPRVVYLSERAKEILRQIPRQLHAKFVWVNPKTGRPWSDPYKMLRRACRELGLNGIWFHDLRRTFVTDTRRIGVPESVVMKLSGHRTRNVFDRYNIIDESDLKAAVAQVDQRRAVSAARQEVAQGGELPPVAGSLPK